MQNPSLIDDTTAQLYWSSNDIEARIFRVIRKEKDQNRFEQLASLEFVTSWKDPRVRYGRTYYYAVIGDDGKGATDTSNVDSLVMPKLPASCKEPLLSVAPDIAGRTVIQVLDRCRSLAQMEILRSMGGEPLTSWKKVDAGIASGTGAYRVVDSTLPANAWVSFVVPASTPDTQFSSPRKDWFTYDHHVGVAEYRELKPKPAIGTLAIPRPLWTLRIGDALLLGAKGDPDSLVQAVDLGDPAHPAFLPARGIPGYPGSGHAAYFTESRSLFTLDETTVHDTVHVVLSRFEYQDGAFRVEYGNSGYSEYIYQPGTGTRELGFDCLMDDSILLCHKTALYNIRGSYTISEPRFAVRMRDGEVLGTFGLTTSFQPCGISGETLVGYNHDDYSDPITNKGFYRFSEIGILEALGMDGPVPKLLLVPDTLYPPHSLSELREGQIEWEFESDHSVYYGYKPCANRWARYGGMICTHPDLLNAASVQIDAQRALVIAVDSSELKIYPYASRGNARQSAP